MKRRAAELKSANGIQAPASPTPPPLVVLECRGVKWPRYTMYIADEKDETVCCQRHTASPIWNLLRYCNLRYSSSVPHRATTRFRHWHLDPCHRLSRPHGVRCIGSALALEHIIHPAVQREHSGHICNACIFLIVQQLLGPHDLRACLPHMLHINQRAKWIWLGFDVPGHRDRVGISHAPAP